MTGSSLVTVLAIAYLARKRRRPADREAEARQAQDPDLEAKEQARTAELAQLQTRKLESLGILAGGLAHDFNNLLGAMAGNMELAKVAAAPEGPVQPFLHAMEGLIARSSSLVKQILAYSGRGTTEVAALDLNRQIEEMVRILRVSMPRKATLRTDPDPDLPLIRGDVAQVQQAIMNLVLNASEAVDADDGVITIRTGQEKLEAAAIREAFPDQGLKPGPHVFMEISDNGPGMAPDVRERIFDPFFTTKFAGRGLGLSVVRGILHSHQGGIQVRTAPGEGATFKLVFPAAGIEDLPQALELPAFEQIIGHYRGTGTVLVVDDEEPLRTITVRALQHIGFSTLEARDGLEALQVFEANRDRIRLILMDLTMPRMDGEEAYRELRSSGMLVPVILTSGFCRRDVIQHFRGKGISGFLQKPYRLHTLVQMIRKALEGADESPGGTNRELREPLAPGPDLDTGNPMIDEQHSRLIESYNRLVASTQWGEQRSQQEKALVSLKEITLTHFGVEETLMESLAYPRTREHQRHHALLIRQINGVAERVHQGNLSIDPALLDFLESWLIHHMQDDDRRLAQFLKSEGH